MSDLLAKLNKQQIEAVTHAQGPLMIVAGAGTGKTTVITHRIAWLIENGFAKPEEIVALTFTEKAASEMEERVDRLLPYGYVDIQISTFHAFAERLLREYGVEIGLSRDFKILSELDAWLLARQNFEKFQLDYYRPLGNPTKYLRSLLTHFSRAKDVGVDPDCYLNFVESKRADFDSAQADSGTTSESDRFKELALAYSTYQNILLENDSLDFGDLMLYTLKLLRERPRVLDEIHRRFKYILVDEFQDTNDAQYEIVRLICEPINNVTVVGDDDQAIYKFRGASLANILRFEKDYINAKRVVLNSNYRSAQSILDHAHAFIQKNNPNRLEVAAVGGLSKKLVSECDIHGHIEHMHSADLDEEVASVVKKILELKEGKPDITWNDFAILVRSNNAGIDFAQGFQRYEIPYQFLALSGLYTKPVVLNMLAYLRIIDDSFDSASMYRLLTSPIVGVSEAGVMQLNQLANRKGKTLYEACEMSKIFPGVTVDDADKVRRLLLSVENYRRQARTRKVGELFVSIAKESGYLEYLNKQDERVKIDDFSYLQQFYERIKSFENRHEHPVLHSFLIDFSCERDAGEEGSLCIDLDSGPDVVRILTVHAAKGLEFRYVFVVNLVDQRFPTRAKKEAIELPSGLCISEADDLRIDAHLEEERRLFYVAMTRAKEGLFFTSADDYGGARKKKLSRFLHELEIEQAVKGNKRQDIFEDAEEKTKDSQLGYQISSPKHFSFTQLAAFKTCPLQYKFAHIIKIPVVGKWTLSFGKTMHNTLHRFFTVWLERTSVRQTSIFDSKEKEVEGIPVSLDELMSMYKDCWQDDWFQNDAQRAKYRELGNASLRDLYGKYFSSPPRPLKLEQGFTMKIGDSVLKGRIDRIDELDGGVEIIDYKTGSAKTEETISKEDKEQLFLYQFACRDVLMLVPKRLTYHYIEDNTQISFLGSDDELDELKDKILDRINAIKSSKFNADPGFHCDYCDFSDICEYRQ